MRELGKMIKVRLTKGIEEAEIVRVNSKSIWCKLSDGNTVKRRNNQIIEEGANHGR